MSRFWVPFLVLLIIGVTLVWAQVLGPGEFSSVLSEGDVTVTNDSEIVMGDGTSTTDPMPIIAVDASGANDGTFDWNNAQDAFQFEAPGNVIFKGSTPAFEFNEDSTTSASTTDGGVQLINCTDADNCGPLNFKLRTDGFVSNIFVVDNNENGSFSGFFEGEWTLSAYQGISAQDTASAKIVYTGTAATYRLDFTGVSTYRFDQCVEINGGLNVCAGTSNVSGACTTGTDGLYVDTSADATGGLYVCENGTWSARK